MKPALSLIFLVVHVKCGISKRLYIGDIADKAKQHMSQQDSSTKELLLRQGSPLVTKSYPRQNPEAYPIGNCEGSCSRNRHCKGDLQCYKRDSFEPVPGCLGEGEEKVGYCYNATLSPATPSPTPRAAPSNVAPTMAPSRSTLAEGESIGKLAKCEGFCRDDDDCSGNLKCQRRNAYEPITGCRGLGERGKDYCYSPDDGPVAPTLPKGPFRLREYWEIEFKWQGQIEERWWCLQEEGGSGSTPRIRECGGGSTEYEFEYLVGPGDHIKVRGKNLCLDLTGSQTITFEKCDDKRLEQRWQGMWSSHRFDIRPVTSSEGCMTQHHHPRNGEPMYLAGCRTAHETNTAYWMRY